jgi:benzoate membrane transport protein
MRNGLSAQAVSAGLLAALIGFASSFAVILRGLGAAGATPTQAASALLALSVAMGVCGILLSIGTRVPVSVVWSTPGAALLIGAPPVPGGYGYAVGAFMLASVLVILAGLWTPLGRLVSAIPRSLANAMLAGVLFELCLAPVQALEQQPRDAIIILLVWAAVGRFRRLYAVPAAVVVTLILAALALHHGGTGLQLHPVVTLIEPRFAWATIASVTIPLFVVTMASQNIPGLAVLHMNGYRPSPRALFGGAGLAGLATAPFGGHMLNLAAMTASLCAGPDAHPDPARRWWAAVVAGIAYIFLGLLSGAITTFIALSSPVLIAAVAGLALLGPLGGALAGATAEPTERDAAILTFLIPASGLNFLGIGGAFWGLAAGCAVLAIQGTGLLRRAV